MYFYIRNYVYTIYNDLLVFTSDIYCINIMVLWKQYGLCCDNQKSMYTFLIIIYIYHFYICVCINKCILIQGNMYIQYAMTY